MLLAANESAVTKKPRLRLMIRRSASVGPLGFFHSSMSRCMLISCGIQWLAQPARYLSHAHLYLNGTSWLTSAEPLITRLSSRRTRVVLACEAWRSTSRSCTGSRDSIPPATCARMVSGLIDVFLGVAAGAMSSSKLSIVCLLYRHFIWGRTAPFQPLREAVSPPLPGVIDALCNPHSPARAGEEGCMLLVHRPQFVVQEFGREILSVEPRDRSQAVVDIELRKARRVPQRFHRFADQFIDEIDDPFAAIVELQPDVVIAEVTRFDDVPRLRLVTGQVALLSR